ncbi:uncharacterized protein J3R85_014490 [Psidium guajava]|nr:uncharacterized protein J3R85_014490 [Psidium guajava]
MSTLTKCDPELGEISWSSSLPIVVPTWPLDHQLQRPPWTTRPEARLKVREGS